MAAVTNYHTLSGFKQRRFICLQFCRSEGVGRAVFLLEASGHNLFPCCFPFLETAYILWLMAASHQPLVPFYLSLS